MKKSYFLSGLVCLCLCLCQSFFAQSLSANEKPDILFILVDDQRNTSLGCAGHPQIKTPVIDSLAASGVRFENMFVNTSICMASRATLFTGLTTTSHGYAGGGGITSTPVIKEDIETSFPKLLREHGYRTGFFGKQHVKFQSLGMDAMFDVQKKIGRSPFMKKMPDGSKRHCGELIGDESIKFLDGQSRDQPFFLYMSFNISHAEDRDKRPGYHFQWPKEEDGLFEDIDPLRPNLDDPKYFDAAPAFLRKGMNRDRYHWRWDTPEKYRTNMRALYRMLKGMDRIVGRVLTKLDEIGRRDNTVVIYSADNGFYMGDRGFAGKWSHYEQSLRVPLIIHDPRLPKELSGRVLKEMAVNLDIPSTILALAGKDIPSKYQGHSLVPILKGETPSDWRKQYYCEHHFGHASIPKWRGVRDQRFTYANYFEHGVELLYDNEKDPTQLVNVANNPEYAGELKRLRAATNQYEKDYTRQVVLDWKDQVKKKGGAQAKKKRNKKK